MEVFKIVSLWLLFVLAMSIIAFNSYGDTEHKEKRIEFGNSLIRGQSIESSAVYMKNRKRSVFSSLLKERQHYREEILEGYYLVTPLENVKQTAETGDSTRGQ